MSEPLEFVPGFELLEKLGEGGMGAVYKARQVSLDRLVAIKVLPRRFGEHPDYVAHFQREAKVEATLKHPNIVQIYEAGNVGRVHYIIMEYVSGYTVADWLARKGRLSVEDALLVAESVARALDYAWSKARIIHGDLKPGNLLVDEDGTIKVGDFLAFPLARREDRQSIFSEHILGTPHYMPPEQLRGDVALDCRSDIYALGAVLYHLISGVLPFSHIPEEAVYEQQPSAVLEDVQVLVPEVSASTAWLVEKMLVRDLHSRPSSWNDVLHDLLRIRRGLALHPPLPREGASAMRRSPQRGKETVERKRASIRMPPGSLRGASPAAAADKESAPADVPGRTGRAILTAVVVAAGLGALAWLLGTGQPVESPAPVPIDFAKRIALPDSGEPSGPEAPPPREKEEEGRRPGEALSGPEFVAPSDKPSAPATTAPQARARDLRVYTALMAKTLGLASRRQYEAAKGAVEAWLDAHPENSYREQAQKEIARIERIQELFATLASQADALRGVEIRAGKNRRGIVKDVSGSQVTLIREFDEGEAHVETELAALPERALRKMFLRLDPERVEWSRALLLTARGRFDAAQTAIRRARDAGFDTAFLEEWAQDWKRVSLNYRAYRALGEAQSKLNAGAPEEGLALLEQAQRDLAESDVFGWAEETKVEQLHQALRAARPAASSPEPAATTEAPAEDAGEFEFFESAEDEPSPETAELFPADDVAHLTIAEVKEQFIALDQSVIRLRFKHRGPIEQVSLSSYKTTLGDEEDAIPVVFPEAGYKWLRSTPRFSGRSPRRRVYALVDAAAGQLQLLGRKQDVDRLKQEATYEW